MVDIFILIGGYKPTYNWGGTTLHLVGIFRIHEVSIFSSCTWSNIYIYEYIYIHIYIYSYIYIRIDVYIYISIM